MRLPPIESTIGKAFLIPTRPRDRFVPRPLRWNDRFWGFFAGLGGILRLFRDAYMTGFDQRTKGRGTTLRPSDFMVTLSDDSLAASTKLSKVLTAEDFALVAARAGQDLKP